MQKADADGYRIHLHFRQDVRDFQRMGEIGLARGAHLSLMFFGGKDVGAADQVEIIPRMVLFDLRKDVLEANHGVPIIGPIKKQAGRKSESRSGLYDLKAFRAFV